MPKKLTNKQIRDGINEITLSYFRATSEESGLGYDSKQHLIAKWALLREISVLLSQKDPTILANLKNDADNWLKTAGLRSYGETK